MTSTECQHPAIDQKAGTCYSCGEQRQPPAPPRLPRELVELVELAARLLITKHGDELAHAAIVVGVQLDGIAAGDEVDEQYPALSPSWPRDVARAAARLAELDQAGQ